MWSRRTILGAATTLPLMAASRVAAAKPAERHERPWTVEDAIKVTADLDWRRSSPWWYELLLYAIVPGATPRLLIAAEGCEELFVRREPDGGFRLRNATVTSFKDVESGEWADTFYNPLTGKTSTVRSNVIQGGSTIFDANGHDVYRDNSDMRASQISDGAKQATAAAPVKIGVLRWLTSGDRVCLVKEGIGGGSYQPLMEVGSTWVARDTLLDTRRTSAEGVYSSSFLSPWMPWMEMGDKHGHLLWHSSGASSSRLPNCPRRIGGGPGRSHPTFSAAIRSRPRREGAHLADAERQLPASRAGFLLPFIPPRSQSSLPQASGT